ncbi:hypothetical protein F383_19104 [Gossypium arboreum]|uniref:Uncharacterized protein n=2 Tax=Gossypium arboreum TaxID=29729 RepID=A0ABR0P666_GOSAR|nr:hypothetical protein PVK06_029275 [Gossypium arboreum]KHG13539.1 hypothetical protein F383_19104 [Gossypium arboreum]
MKPSTTTIVLLLLLFVSTLCTLNNVNARSLICKSSKDCINQCGSPGCPAPATCTCVSGKCDCAHIEIAVESVFGPLNGHT